MAKDKKIGAVTGKILSFNSRIDSCGQLLGKMRKPIERGHNQFDKGQFDKLGYVFGTCAALALFRKEMLEDTALSKGEYFDNDYGVFYEDLDLNWRANRFGWRVYFTPQALAYHKRGLTAQSSPVKIKFFRKFAFCNLPSGLKLQLLRNRYATIIKNDRLFCFVMTSPFILAYDMLLWGYICLSSPEIIYKFFSNFSWFKRAFAKRRKINSNFKKRKYFKGQMKPELIE
jgi:GT2 family glycosyltransferase